MTRPDTDTMPHYAAAAWKMTTQTTESKGLNAAKIVQAASTIADQDGLGAVTIRSVAKQTGFSTMAIYRHIESRDELMVLLIESVLGTAPSFSKDTWQDNVQDWADALLERYTSHIWALALPISGIPTTPNRISWVEQILRILAPTGLSLQARLDVALLIDGHVRQFATFATQSNVQSSHPWLQNIASDSAPTLLLALQQGALQSQKGPDFTAGLHLIIKGVQASMHKS